MEIFRKCGHPKTAENLYNTKRAQCKTCNRRAVQRRDFGPNAVEHRAKQLRLQKGGCAICLGTVRHTLKQDHDHNCCPNRLDKKGTVRIKACGKCLRGLLCADCNFWLSFLEKETFVRREAYLLRDYLPVGTTKAEQLKTQRGKCACCHKKLALINSKFYHDHSCCISFSKPCGSCYRGVVCVDCSNSLLYLHYCRPQMKTWRRRAERYLAKWDEIIWCR
jgi:Recombination endonuclease VII